MANPLTSSSFRRALKDDLTEVAVNAYKEIKPMREMLYRTFPSQQAFEEFWGVGAVPDIPSFTGELEYLEVAPGYYNKIEPAEFAGGVQFERKFTDDEQYGIMRGTVAGLGTAAARTQEKIAVRGFTQAFSASFDYQTSEEGVALCSDSHTTKAGTSTSTGFDNAGTSALNKVNLAATRILMRGFRNDISERIEVSDNLAIVCPDNLADTAAEIVGTQIGYDEATQTKNMDYKRYAVIPYMRLDDNDTNNWFMVDQDAMKKWLIWIDRIMPDYNDTVDFETFLYKFSVYFRVAYGYLDWRWVFGHQVS